MNAIILHSLVNGTGGAAFAYTAMRVCVGSFYAIAGAHKLTRSEDWNDTVSALRADIGFAVPFFAWFVPGVEFAAGCAVTLGLLTPLASLGLIAVSLVAFATDAVKKIPGWNPTDIADYVDDVFYLPEFLYAVMLVCFVAAGSGPYGLDSIVAAFVR